MHMHFILGNAYNATLKQYITLDRHRGVISKKVLR